MAEIKDVALQIQPSNVSGKMKVKVGFKLIFSPSEAGKGFKYGISLHGEDKPGDDEASFLTTGQVLYKFLFKSGFLLPKPHKSVTAQVGEQSFSETREVLIKTLNEDPGFITIQVDMNTPPLALPHADEVYATVSLVADEKRSPTVTLLL